jgi:hypothetical protein
MSRQRARNRRKIQAERYLRRMPWDYGVTVPRSVSEYTLPGNFQSLKRVPGRRPWRR